MRIPLHLEIVCRESVGEVIERVRRAGVWRESEMPEWLRRKGVLSAEVTVVDNRFSIRLYYGAISWYNYYDARVIGSIEPHPQGSVLRATCRVARLMWLAPGLLVIGNLQELLRFGTINISGLLLTIVVSALVARIYFWRSHEESRHLLFLLDRLNASLADVEGSGRNTLAGWAEV
jgi:hypothetical protein